MPYKFTDVYTTADVGMVVTGQTLNELFIDAARGMTEIIVDPDGLDDRREVRIELEADNLDDLFFIWLSEIIYHKDADSFLVKKGDIDFDFGDRIRLRAKLQGDTIDKSRHTLKTDVKAVTLYRLKVEQINDHWQGEAVFDL
ncbi:MAG: archease [Candidatus Zixiibacteriota bacterium]